MKNLYSKNEFLLERNRLLENEKLNEGFFDFLGKIFNKIKNQINKVKGGKEIEAIYQKYIGFINAEFAKKIDAGLQLAEAGENPIKTETKPAEGTPKTGTKPVEGATKESYSYSEYTKLYEIGLKDVVNKVTGAVKGAVAGAKAGFKGDQPAGNQPAGNQPAGNQADNQPSEQSTEQPQGEEKPKNVDVLKQKQQVIQQIIKLYKAKAEKEMNAVLLKYGGDKNPKLKTILDNKLLQFDLDLLNAEVKYAEKVGDKVMSKKLAVERDKKSKELDVKWNLDAKPNPNAKVQIIDIAGKKLKVGVPYRYKTDKKGVKIVKVTKASDDKKSFIGTFMDGNKDVKIGIEQKFDPNKLDLGFKPVKNAEYNYFSQTNKKTNGPNPIKVQVIGNVNDKTGKVKVKTENGEIFVPAGALMNIPKVKEKEVPAQAAQSSGK